MLTNSLIEEMMMASLRSPMDLSDRLGLRPSTYQLDLMQRFYDGVEPLEVTEIPAQRTTEALALCALWRLLRIEGSRVLVIASNRDLESRFMGFLHTVTTQIDPALTSVCRWPSSKVLKIGDAAGHELRFMSNHPQWAAGIHDPSLLTVVLGARSSEPRFIETMQVLRSIQTGENCRQIIMW
jgi:hypothetical protein